MKDRDSFSFASDSVRMRQDGSGSAAYLYFPVLEESGLVRHGFSTRLGGVSKGCFSSMNLGLSRGDSRENVLENFRRICGALGVSPEQMVFSHQTHTTNVRRVDAADAGKGIWRPRTDSDVDGMITDVPGLVLVTFYADCVPLYFLDPVHRAIGLSHSGWRGTVGRIGRNTLEAMHAAYGTDPGDVIACIGPSICGNCYEVGPEVAVRFMEQFGDGNGIVTPGREGHFQLDLWKANAQILLEAGIVPEHLCLANVCTRCNPDVFYSHRIMGNARGSLAAFLSLREEVRGLELR